LILGKRSAASDVDPASKNEKIPEENSHKSKRLKQADNNLSSS
jgi:hypothetical protein